MATTFESVPSRPAARINLKERPTSTLAFDGLMSLLAVWFMAGLFLDGAAHARNSVESFFTPWHAILYSGFLANALAVFAVTFRNMSKGYTRWLAIPAGYEMTFVGAIIFGIGGVLDLIWHTVFGIEVNLEALISPSHLILALGLMLIVNGPFRAAWRRADPPLSKILAWLPMLLSLLYTLSVLTFFTFPMHPFVNVWAGLQVREAIHGDTTVQIGLPAILLQSAFLMGCLLLAIRRWTLPFGSVAFVLTLNSLLLSVISRNSQFVPIAFAAGVFADVLILVLKPSVMRPVMFRVFAFAVPLVLYILYFVVIATSTGLAWSLPLWGGTAVLAGVTGLLISYLLIPSPSMQIDPVRQ